jgi:hypothetical protein
LAGQPTHTREQHEAQRVSDLPELVDSRGRDLVAAVTAPISASISAAVSAGRSDTAPVTAAIPGAGGGRSEGVGVSEGFVVSALDGNFFFAGRHGVQLIQEQMRR